MNGNRDGPGNGGDTSAAAAADTGRNFDCGNRVAHADRLEPLWPQNPSEESELARRADVTFQFFADAHIEEAIISDWRDCETALERVKKRLRVWADLCSSRQSSSCESL